MQRGRWLTAAFVVASTCCASRATTQPSAAAVTPVRILATQAGLASFYAEEFHGRTTASGATFDMNALVAAHPSYPFGTVLRVTNIRNGRSVRVRVIDRGPTRRLQHDGVIVDVSRRAAADLGIIRDGRARVRVDVLKWGH